MFIYYYLNLLACYTINYSLPPHIINYVDVD